MKRTSEMTMLVWAMQRLALSGRLPAGDALSVEECGALNYRAARTLYALARLEGFKDGGHGVTNLQPLKE